MAICTLTGTIVKADSSPMSGQQILAVIKSTQVDQGGQVVDSVGVSSTPIEAFTKDDGSFSIDLLQGATVVLEIPAINLRKEVLIPALTTADFTALV